MNIYFKAIQKAFDLLNDPKTKQSSFMTALEYMLKIANESEYEVEKCVIMNNKDGNIIIMLDTKKAALTISAHSKISYTGKGPKKEDNICTINTESYSVSNEVFEWIKRNSK